MNNDQRKRIAHAYCAIMLDQILVTDSYLLDTYGEDEAKKIGEFVKGMSNKHQCKADQPKRTRNKCNATE